jgi:K+-sensing histidine kinase KdpD
MQHGNIYPEKNIERALGGFFRPGNLAALRELALNWLANTEADRIADDELLVARENVLAAVREPLQSQPLIRRAVRMSKRYRGDCTIVTVLRPGEPLADELEPCLTLAEALEARFEVLTGTDPAQALVEAVRRHDASQLLIGAPGGKFMERYRGSLVDRLLDELTNIDMHIIARFDPIDVVDIDPKATVESTTEDPAADPIGTEGGERGYLRIYLGYAPGTGTTSTMLREGQRRAARGTRVVVGAAATYGLPANKEAMEGLTVIPPRVAPSRPGGSGDMDLAAVMASGAQVVCVDDLGYVNRAPDAKYRFRYEEVEALRSAGFKVVATVHLRDVARVADVVGAATGIPTEGNLPDWVLRHATELELVDVPPAVLLERLERHDVPISPERREELRSIYTIGVLGRLREIALRLVASHTDDRLLAYMEARGITSPWESMARVMAAVAPQPGLEPLIERAAAGARRSEGKLVVVSVDSSEGKDPEAPNATALYQALTMKLGGQFVVLKSSKPGQALLDYAKRTHVTEIVLARGDHKEKAGPLGSSIKRDIIRGASEIDVHVLRAFETAHDGTGLVPV